MADNVGSKVTYFLVGLGVGALVGVLFAPKSGEETREFLSKKADEGRDYAQRKAKELRERADELIERSKDVAVRTARIRSPRPWKARARRTAANRSHKFDLGSAAGCAGSEFARVRRENPAGSGALQETAGCLVCNPGSNFQHRRGDCTVVQVRDLDRAVLSNTPHYGNVNGLVTDLHTRMGPILTRAQILLDDTQPKISNMVATRRTSCIWRGARRRKWTA